MPSFSERNLWATLVFQANLETADSAFRRIPRITTFSLVCSRFCLLGYLLVPRAPARGGDCGSTSPPSGVRRAERGQACYTYPSYITTFSPPPACESVHFRSIFGPKSVHDQIFRSTRRFTGGPWIGPRPRSEIGRRRSMARSKIGRWIGPS